MTKVRQERKSLKPGDHVEWNTSWGTTAGVVKEKLTEPADVKGHHVGASEDNPEFLVASDKTGAEAAHRPDALTKITKGT
jgi:hypothetical protein